MTSEPRKAAVGQRYRSIFLASYIDRGQVDPPASDTRLDRLVRAAKLVGGTTTVLARVPIGLAVKSGAPHPDISSVEAVKRTLLDAKSIAYVDPASGGTSGIFLAQALEKLGIAAELKSKVRLVSPTAGQSSPRTARSSSEVRLRSGYSRAAS